MTSRSALRLLLLIAAASTVVPARAADQPISGMMLMLRRTASGKERLLFRSKDPAFLFPAPGSADDPATGTPGGATVELFSQNGDTATFAIPAGAGDPGWRLTTGAVPAFMFLNRLAPGGPSPLRSATLRQGRMLAISGKSVGLALAGAQDAIGIRITTGSLRNCALFDAATIRRDEAGYFSARDAVAASLSDCSNASLGGPPPPCTGGSPFPVCDGTCDPGSDCSTQDLVTCVCISSAQPCGETFPVCSGECVVGEECLPIGGFPLPSCACLPAGSVPCTQFGCGGVCPAGQECNFFELSTPGGTGCTCGPPGPCGSGGDDCPPGFHCAVAPGFASCVPD